MNRKHKQVFASLNYIKHFLILAFTITGCISTSAFASLFGISIGITSSAIGLKICAKATGSKRYKSMFKKRKTKHNEINSKVLIDSDINNDEFVVINKCAKRI